MALETGTGCCKLLKVFCLVQFALKLLKSIDHPFADSACDVRDGNLLQKTRTLNLKQKCAFNRTH
jgi:hypothetical protein